MKAHLLFIFLLIPFYVLSAPYGSITGKVVDKSTGEALPGVNVIVEGTLLGASTDSDGRFIVPKVPPGFYSLRVSMIGYLNVTVDDVRVQVNRTTTVDFELEPTTIEFDPIVVLAGKTEQRLDRAPVSISVVTAKEIQRRNAIDITEVLETAPGVNFIGDQINIRGSTGFTFGAGNKVLLLLDGVPVYASDTGEFNWDMLPPLDIEQIEILKGAGSTLWGASALGGVVNIQTKDPTEEGKLLFSFSSGLYDEPAFEIWKYTDKTQYYHREDVSFSKRFGNFGMRLSAGHYNTTGYRQLGKADKYNFTGKFDYRFKGGIKWMGYIAYSDIYQGIFVQWKGANDPYEVDESNLDNYADTNQMNAYMKLAIPFSSRFALNIRGSMVRTLMGNQFGDQASFNPALGQGFEVQATWIPHPAHTITAGTQFQQDAGSTKYFGDHTGFFIGPYLQNEWKMRKNVTLTTGLRYDRYQLIGDEREDLWSPRFGINWQPWKSTSLRGSVGSGFRAATIVERFLELSIMNFKIKANPDLRPEHSWAYDIGVRHYFNTHWNLDVSLFRNEYWDLIEAHLDLIRGQIQFRNVERARIEGIEATMNWSYPTHIGKTPVEPGLVISTTIMDHENLKWNEPLTYRPKRLFSARASIMVGKTMTEFIYRYASKIDEVKIYPINKRVPMKFVDVRASYDFGPLTLQFGVNNLLNYNYASRESNMEPMRTFTAGLKGEL